MKTNIEARNCGKGKLRLVCSETVASPEAVQTINRTEALLRLPEVKSLAGISRSEIYRRISEGGFPKPVKLGSRTNVWLLSEVQAWIAARIAARDAKEVQA